MSAAEAILRGVGYLAVVGFLLAWVWSLTRPEIPNRVRLGLAFTGLFWAVVLVLPSGRFT